MVWSCFVYFPYTEPVINGEIKHVNHVLRKIGHESMLTNDMKENQSQNPLDHSKGFRNLVCIY